MSAAQAVPPSTTWRGATAACSGSIRLAVPETNTPDRHFLIDPHPNRPQAGFSGQGFKFSSVAGGTLADLAGRGETRHDISWLRLRRFAARGAAGPAGPGPA